MFRDITNIAEALTTNLVTNYKEIEAKIDEGTTNRSIASTNMNATSRRVFTYYFIW